MALPIPDRQTDRENDIEWLAVTFCFVMGIRRRQIPASDEMHRDE